MGNIRSQSAHIHSKRNVYMFMEELDCQVKLRQLARFPVT